jgi:hypothetical protein
VRGGIRCVITVDQVEVVFEIIDVLVTNEELFIVDVGPSNESVAVPLRAISARVPIIAMFGRVIRLLISRFQLLIVIS